MTNPAADSRISRGTARLQEGLFDDAVDAFTAALTETPNDPRALQGRAMARFQMKDWVAAETDFAAAKKADESDPRNWSGLALSQAMQNKVYPALALFEDLLVRWPDFTEARIQLGLLCLKIGAIAKGRDHLRDALNTRPTLAQRRLIESTLKEQEKLDANRYYRPDFERLKAQAQEPFFVKWLARLWIRFRRSPTQEDNKP